MPKRGFAALLITTGALILLLSFKTPDRAGRDAADGRRLAADQGTGAVTSDVATPAPARDGGAGRCDRDAGPGQDGFDERVQDRRRPRRLDAVR